ncbi:MAG: hypothetical protein F6K31_26360 [Symploca sp. SIO2G7]|nr:hypothetical protein [Symploca sp. SIO2G7]
MTSFLQKIWLIFIISVLVVIFFLPTSNPAYTDEGAANPVDTVAVEAISILEPVNQPTQEINLSSKITSVEQVSDVSPSEPYFNALKKLIEVYQMDITLPDGSFQGNQSLTRGDFIIYLRDSLEVINKLQELPRVASVTGEQVATTADLIDELEDKADVLSQKIQQIKTRIYLLDDKVKQSEQSLLVKAILDSSLTSNQSHSDEKDLATVSTFQETRQQATGNRQQGRESDVFLPCVAGGNRRQWDCSEEVVASQPINSSEPEIDLDLLAPVNPGEEISDVSDIATVNTFQETRQQATGNRQQGRESDVFLPCVAGGNRRQWDCSEEVVASQPVNSSEPEIDLLAPVNPAEEILDVSDVATVNTFQETRQQATGNRQQATELDVFLPCVADGNRRQWGCSEEVVASNQIKQIENIPDVSLDDPYYDALREIIENYQVDVTLPDGTFKGNQSITRSEVIIYLNDSISAAEELIAFNEEEASSREPELSFDNLSLQIAQADSYFAEKLAQIEQIESQLDELECRIVQDAQSR